MSRPVPSSTARPKKDSIQLDNGSAVNAGKSSGGRWAESARRSRSSRMKAVSDTSLGRVERRNVSPMTCVGSTSAPKSWLCHPRNLCPSLLIGSIASKRRRGSNALELPRVKRLTGAADQHRHVCSLAAPIRVQFVQHEKTQSPRRLNKLPFSRAREDRRLPASHSWSR